jgi:hypothetical protein
VVRTALRTFDRLVRHFTGVFEFNGDPACILRARFCTAAEPIGLHDTAVLAGELLLEFHLWNERIPPLPARGADLAWSLGAFRSFVHSLELLASFLRTDPRAAKVQAIGAITVLGGTAEDAGSLLPRLGFTASPRLRHLRDAWDNAYAWALMWTFNPASLRSKRLRDLRRTGYWMSRQAFLERFGARRC